MSRPNNCWDPSTLIPGFVSLEHWLPVHDVIALRTLVQLVKQHRHRTVRIVEIGSFIGTSAIVFADMGCEVFCVDPWEKIRLPEGYDPETDINGIVPQLYAEHDIYDIFMENTRHYRSLIHPIRMPSAEAADKWLVYKHDRRPRKRAYMEGLVDMVYIDGDHSLESVRRDIAAWWPKLAQNRGIMSGHDYHDQCPGVIQGANEIAATGIDGILGWCVWFKFRCDMENPASVSHEWLQGTKQYLSSHKTSWEYRAERRAAENKRKAAIRRKRQRQERWRKKEEREQKRANELHRRRILLGKMLRKKKLLRSQGQSAKAANKMVEEEFGANLPPSHNFARRKKKGT